MTDIHDRTPDATPTPATILRAALRSRGMSPEQCALIGDVSRSAVYRLLAGQATMRRTRRDICRALGLPVDALEPRGGSK